MRKTRYYYNPATCSYEIINTSIRAFLLWGCTLMIFSVGLAFLIVKYYNSRFISPREAELLEDNEKLQTYYRVVKQQIEKSETLLAALQDRDASLYRVILNAPPLSSAQRNAGTGGVDKYAHLAKDVLIAQTLSKAEHLLNKLTAQKKSYDQILDHAQKSNRMLQSMPTFPPIHQGLFRLAGSFGARIHPIFKIHHMHTGVDLAAPLHTPVYAAANGYVQKIKHEKKGYGNSILIDHGHGFQTRYAHMHSITIKEKQKVVRGQQIGTVGQSGHATGPHLHCEVFYNRKHVDPLYYFAAGLTAAEYHEVRKQASTLSQTLCY